VTSSGYYSGYAIANPNAMLAVQTEATIEVVDANGNVLQTQEVSLSPRGMHTGVVPESALSGYVRITANMPVRVVGSIGTSEARLLEQVPAIAQ
jgi:hypothetical protein